jgi:hypothetical protein
VPVEAFMRLDVLDGYVWLERNPETKHAVLPEELRERLYPIWLQDLVSQDATPEEVTAFEDEYFHRVSEELDKISHNRQNWLDRGVPVGRSEVKIGDKNVPVKEVLMTASQFSSPSAHC